MKFIDGWKGLEEGGELAGAGKAVMDLMTSAYSQDSTGNSWVLGLRRLLELKNRRI